MCELNCRSAVSHVFILAPDVNNESKTNEIQQRWPHGDRPAVSRALNQAFITGSCPIGSNYLNWKSLVSEKQQGAKKTKNKKSRTKS